MKSLPSAAEYSVPNHRVSAVDKGGAGGDRAPPEFCDSKKTTEIEDKGGAGGDKAPAEFCDSKKATEIEIDRQFVTTDSPEFEKISTDLRVDVPESFLRC